MLIYKKGLYHFIGVGLVFGFAFQIVKCDPNGCQRMRPGCRGILEYNASHYATWEDAKKRCSECNATLLGLNYVERKQHCFSEIRGDEIWIGLKKKALNRTEFLIDDLFKIRKCESRNTTGDLRHVSCSDNLLPSLCERENCKQCGKNEKECFAPVNVRMTWFDAFANCKGNWQLDARDVVCDARRNFSGYFWTGKIYETDIDTHGNWRWINGSIFEGWDEWKIIIMDVGCGGCCFWRNGTIYLTSSCSKKLSYLCDSDRQFNINSSLLSRPELSWESANGTCRLLQLTKHDDNVTDALVGEDKKKQNMSFWLGIYKANTCKTQLRQSLSNITELKLDNCYSVESPGGNRTLVDCDAKNYAICIKAGISGNCPNNWNRTSNGSCWRAFYNIRMTWKAAHVFCLQQGGRLANLSSIRAINTSFLILSDERRYWINEEIYAYFQGWYNSNGESLDAKNVKVKLQHTDDKERCAFIQKKNGKIYLKDSACDSPRRSFICKKNHTCNWEQIPDFLRSHLLQNKNITDLQRHIREKKYQNNTNWPKRPRAVYQHDRCKRSLHYIKKVLTRCLYLWKESYNSTENGTLVVEMNTTSLERLHKWRDNITTIPNMTIWDLCQNEPNCTVKRVIIQIKDLLLNISNSFDPVYCDVIMLNYFANELPISQLKGNETVSLKFAKEGKPKNFRKEQVRCLFLDNDEWSTKGMTVGSVDGEYIECLTNHLSTFTMVVLEEGEGSESNSVALKFITYIGSGLSLAGLLITCIVYILLYKDLQILTTSRHLVHFNLQIALGLTQLVFLAGGSVTNDETICKVIAIMVHYFSLAGFTWILLEAVMLYLKLISVYGGEFVKMKNFLLFGWGFPLLLVGLSAGVKIDSYGTDQWCWLSYEDGFVWVFFAPVIIITVVTFVVIIAVLRVLIIASKSDEAGSKKHLISAARCVIILFPTLGFSWGFSVIAVNHDAIIWKYLFAIFTSLQGFFIFLVYGVCNAEIRHAIGRKMGYNVYPSATTM